jgi:hypothetical protein
MRGVEVMRGIQNGGVEPPLRRRKRERIFSGDVANLRPKRKMPGRFAEGPRHPGFILPASAVSEQENQSGYV